MSGFLAKISRLLIAMFIIGAFAMPHVCFADHHNNTGKVSITEHIKAEKSTSSEHQNSKLTDNCCVANHCCMKVLPQFTTALNTVISTKIVHIIADSQSEINNPVDGLKRPPKSFV